MKKFINFLFEIGTLRKIPRAHRQSLLTEDVTDNISSHSYRVTHIGYILAKLENADILKVVTMCLFHDIEETRAGDQNRIHKRYVTVAHDQIRHDQIAGLYEDQELLQVMHEYEERESRESKIAKDADRLDQFFLLKEHALGGNQEAMRWFASKYNGSQRDDLYCDSAKKMFDDLLTTLPSEWWEDVWTEHRKK